MGRRIKFLTPFNLLLFLILALAVFFRVYNIVSLHGFAIDADLYSWIVKDIVYGKHIRLVGQLTSTEGVYIGPLFYYLMVPFFLITRMDPIGAVIFAIFLGVLTVFSFYLVFKKILGSWVGIIAGFLQAVLPLRVGFDRWVVPTMTVNLWCIWFFHSIYKLVSGDMRYLIPGLFLTGLIWHIHLALIPLVILLPIAIILSRKKPNKKIITLGLLAFIIPMLPFILFEIRHQFLQTSSFFSSLTIKSNILFLEKAIKIFDQSLGRNFYLKIVLLLLPVVLYRIKAVSVKLLIIFYVWIFSVIVCFIVSSKETSEYYFTSTQTIFLILFIYLLAWLIKVPKIGLSLVVIIMILSLVYSLSDLLKQSDSGKGYKQKKEVARFIKADSLEKNLGCFSITYITSPGENTGFRYLFWFNDMRLEEPKTGIPNYTIVLPYNLSPGSIGKRFGIIGVILPESGYNLNKGAINCSGKDYNLSEPLWGYTD